MDNLKTNFKRTVLVKLTSLIGLFLLALSTSLAVAAPADLDTSFGVDGFGGPSGVTGGFFVLHPDGRILFINSNPTNLNIGVGVYDDSGNQSGTGGTANPTDGEETVRAAVIQLDGKLVVTGYSTFANGDEDIFVTRFNADLTPDSSFGNTGSVNFDLSDTANSQAHSIGIQPDGKILVAPANLSSTTVALIRLNTDGSIDTNFGTAGEAMLPANIFFRTNFNNRRIPVLADGKIYLGGTGINNNFDLGVLRYLADGTLDTSYGDNGFAFYQNNSQSDTFRDITIQNDEKVIIAGRTIISNDGDMTLVRFNTDGSLDSSFATAGVLRLDVGGTLDVGIGVIVQPDGKIVFGGLSTRNLPALLESVIARYESDGTPDMSFATNGVLLDPALGTELMPTAIQSDGKILALVLGAPTQIARFEGDAVDTLPDAISFTDENNVALSTIIESDIVVVSGLSQNVTVPIIVESGEYRINAGNYINSRGYVENGDQLQLRHTSGSSENTAVNTTLTLGGVNDTYNLSLIIGANTSDTFTSTTESTVISDTTPDMFNFTDQTDVAINSSITSDAIVVAGIDAATDISITGGEYSINGATPVSAAGTVVSADSITVSLQSSGSNSATTNAVLTIGGVSDTFSVTTAVAPPPPVTPPSSGGGGSFGSIYLGLLLLIQVCRKKVVLKD